MKDCQYYGYADTPASPSQETHSYHYCETSTAKIKFREALMTCNTFWDSYSSSWRQW